MYKNKYERYQYEMHNLQEIVEADLQRAEEEFLKTEKSFDDFIFSNAEETMLPDDYDRIYDELLHKFEAIRETYELLQESQEQLRKFAEVVDDLYWLNY